MTAFACLAPGLETPGRTGVGDPRALAAECRPFAAHMRRPVRVLGAMATALAVAGCTSLAPELSPPKSPLLEAPAALVAQEAPASAAADLPTWREFLRDPGLREAVQDALSSDRDLRIALLRVESSRAELQLAEADRWPTVAAGLSAERAPDSNGSPANTWRAGLQLTSYEIDLLGRLRSLDRAAAANLLATQAAARAARLTLITETAASWLTQLADEQRLQLAERSLAARQGSLELTELRARVGAASDIELQAVRALVADAQVSVATLQRQLGRNANALAQLRGVPDRQRAAAAGRPQRVEGRLGDELLAAVPELPSEVLLGRPDVMQAEQQLAAAQANIGAARAALFPRLVISGSAGTVSDGLRALLQSGSFAWTLAGETALTLFDGGRQRATLRQAELAREIAVEDYQKAIELAFQEAADGLVAQSTWRAQVQALQQQVAAEGERLRLTRLRHEAGVASLLELLDADRSAAAVEQALVQARLGELLNRLALYKALGGEQTEGK